MIDLGANPQAASDAARFSHLQASNELDLESNLYKLVGPRLRAMGHQVKSANGEDMGGYQAIWYTPYAHYQTAPGSDSANQPLPGVYRAASDHRKDGEAIGW